MRDCDSLKSTVARRCASSLPDGHGLLQIDLCPEKLFGIKATFGESNSEPALGAIMCALYETCANQIANSILHLDFRFEIEAGQRDQF